jgi:hypothetical protein
MNLSAFKIDIDKIHVPRNTNTTQINVCDEIFLIGELIHITTPILQYPKVRLNI